MRPASGQAAVAPAGIHLRWSFSGPLGFPSKGFSVFRRPGSRPSLTCVRFDNVDKDTTISSGQRVRGIQLFAHESLTLGGTGNAWLDVEWTPLGPADAPPPLRLVFDEPVVAVEVQFGDRPSGQPAVLLQAHDERGLVAESRAIFPVGSAGLLGIRVQAPAITHAFLVPAFGQLHGICTTTHARECAEGWTTLVAELPLPRPPRSEAEARRLLEERVGRDVRNRYARDFGEAEGRYVGESTNRYVGRVGELLTWLQAVVEGWPDYIENPDDPPHLRRAMPPTGPTPLKPVHPQALLLLAALDPNIARLLSLGWVDRFRPTDETAEPPEEGRAYDYKVVGHWPDGDLCGLVLGVGATVDGVPTLAPEEPVTAGKLAGRRWDGTEPLHRVGVRWNRPPATPGPSQAVRPVAFDVWRQRLGTTGSPTAAKTVLLTAKHPAVVPESAWKTGGPPHLVDPEVPRGTFWYQVAGIDLFGQTGRGTPLEAQTSDGTTIVTIVDEEAPPAPSRLEARLVQPGYPWLTPEQRARTSEPGQLALRFRYGAFHYRQAPDIESFTLYWRPGRLIVTTPITAKPISDAPVVDARTGSVVHEYVAEIVSTVPPRLERFVGIVRLPSEGETPLPARHHLRIAGIMGANQLRLAPGPAELAPEPARYALVADPHRLDDWSPLTPAIPARPPVDGVVRATPTPEDFGAMVVKAWPARLPPMRSPDPFALLPAVDRPEFPVVEDGIDVVIDRTLLEAELFRGGRAEAAGRAFDILASSSGPAYAADAPFDVAAGLRLKPTDPDDLDPGLPDGVELRLYPPPPPVEPDEPVTSRALLAYLEIDASLAGHPPPPPGGELAFEVWRPSKPPASDDPPVSTDRERLLMVGEVVSDIDWKGTRLGALVRFPGSLEPSELPRPGQIVRYFRDYLVERPVSINPPTSAGSTLRLTMPPGEAATSAYFAASSRDRRGNTSRLSSAVQVTAVRPPPRGQPSAPFPCGHPERDGYATPPNREGRATVCLEWIYNGPAEEMVGLKFEVGRALDQTVIATDRRNWLVGRSAPGREPAPGLPPTPITIVSVEPVPGASRHRVTAELAGDSETDAAFADGLLWKEGAFLLDGPLSRTGGRVTFEVAAPAAPAAGQAELHPLPIPPVMVLDATVDLVSPERDLYRVLLAEGSLATDAITGPLAGACLIQTREEGAAGPRPARFLITRASAEGDLVLLVRPVAGDTPVRGACRIETAPDYARVIARPRKLRQLADKPGNEEAFGVVTGVPVDGWTFRDEIPGVGRSAFLYRVRAVDPANSRSAWSPASAPFWQVDTTPPETPRNLRIVPDDRSVELRWTVPLDPRVDQYYVYRTDGSPETFHPATATPITVAAQATEPARPTIVGGLVAIPGRAQATVWTSMMVSHLQDGSPTGPNLFVGESGLTRFTERRVESLNPLVPDGTPARVWIGNPAVPLLLTHRPGTGEPLVVQVGAIDLTFGLSIIALEAVFRADRVREDADLEALLASPVPEALAEAPRDLGTLTISGLETLFAEGTEVVAIVRLSDGTLRAIRQAPGRAEPLRVQGGTVRLDVDVADDSLLRVERADANSEGLPGERPPDLRLVRPSDLLVAPGPAGAVVAIAGLNPLVRDGTPASITLVDEAGAEHRFDGDPGTRTWRDTGLHGGRRYHYWLSTTRRLYPPPSSGDAESGGDPSASGDVPDTRLRSEAAGPVSAVVLDRSVPDAPLLTAIEWIPPQDDAATGFPMARLTLAAPGESTGFARAERAARPEGPWATVSATGGPGWHSWPAGAGTLTLIDAGADPVGRHWYRVQLRTLDDRLSRPGDPVEAPMPGGG